MNRVLLRAGYAGAAVYLCVSVLYTSMYLLLCPFLADCPNVLAIRSFGFTGFPSLAFRDAYPTAPSIATTLKSAVVNSYPFTDSDQGSEGVLSVLDSVSSSALLDWSYGDSKCVAGAICELQHQRSDDGTTSMSESLFLSKAFSNSMQPMKIIPFFYKASSNVQADDITITTLVTSNRYEVLKKLAERYEGPLSVTIHISVPTLDAPSDSLNASLSALHALILGSPALAARADIHLVVSPFVRAFNAWRNLARLLARTEYVLLLDVDFAVCTDWREPVRALLRGEGGGHNAEMAKRIREGRAALVLPAFEYVHAVDGKEPAWFPKNKRSLLHAVQQGKITSFHVSWAPGHNSTDYRRFYSARPGEMYRVTEYQSAYEPYVIVKKDIGGWCDERFTGYGGNKAACLFEMYISGVSFYVLSDHFVIHQSHAYEEQARKSERRYNRKIYSDFKEEACLRYIQKFRSEGVLNTTRAHNALDECPKIKGISRLLTQLLEVEDE